MPLIEDLRGMFRERRDSRRKIVTFGGISMAKLSVDMKEKEDEIYALVVEKAEAQKKTDEIKYKIAIARAELKALRTEEKADKE